LNVDLSDGPKLILVQIHLLLRWRLLRQNLPWAWKENNPENRNRRKCPYGLH